MVANTNEANIFKTNIILKPVYLEIINGVEQLVYNSRMMELNKQYRIRWSDEEFILVKNDNRVDFYRFFPET